MTFYEYRKAVMETMGIIFYAPIELLTNLFIANASISEAVEILAEEN